MVEEEGSLMLGVEDIGTVRESLWVLLRQLELCEIDTWWLVVGGLEDAIELN